ncbi:MAG: sigma-70 family RNA polymerase sigma factor [Polyangiaceae bacterium]
MSVRRSGTPLRPLSAAQQQLVREASRIVNKIAAKARARGSALDVDELASLGREGLIEAALSFDPGYGVTFEGFAWPRVDGAMKNGVERELAEMRTRMSAAYAASYGFAEAQTDEGDLMTDTEQEVRARLDAGCDGFAAAMAVGFFTASGGIEGEDAAVARETYARAIDAVREAMETLPPRDRQLIALHYEDQLDLKQVAERLGFSYGSARRYHHSAMQRLGARMRARGISAAPPPAGVHG